MIDLQKVIKEVSQHTGYDLDIVEDVCRHPFVYTVNTMKDDLDTKDI